MIPWNPFEPLLKALIDIRNWMFDKKYLSSITLDIPVVSIGNITMGGTGKTPFIDWLAKDFEQSGYRVGVVSRSYKGSLREPEWVVIGPGAEKIFGDEPLLLKSKNPLIPMVAGPQKWKCALKLAEQKETVDIILVDDGFQHRRLERNFDIVLLDSSADQSDYAWPPFGRARESLASLKRADVVVFTKWEQRNEKSQQLLDREMDKLKGEAPLSLIAEQVIGDIYRLEGTDLSESSMLSSDVLQKGQGFAFCGLGHPQSFLQSLKVKGLKIKDFHFLSDHAKYSQEDIEFLEARGAQADYFITTEKDAIKLKAWRKEGPPLFIAPLSLKIAGDLEAFHEKLNEAIRKRN